MLRKSPQRVRLAVVAVYTFLMWKTFYPVHQQSFTLNFALSNHKWLPDISSKSIDRTYFFCLCIPVMQFVGNSIFPTALSPSLCLSLSGWRACPLPVIGRGFPAGLALLLNRSLLYSVLLAAEQMKCICCYGQWRKWQWIQKYADDSTWNSSCTECRRGSVSTASLQKFPMMLAGISVWR